MPKLRPHVLAALLLLAGAAGPALAAQDQSAPLRDTYDNVYRILHLDLHTAELLAWKECEQREQIGGAHV